MARIPEDPELRQKRIDATRFITCEIKERSGLSAGQLEKLFNIGSPLNERTNSGRTWNRYMHGERAMDHETMDRIAREALKQGMLPPKLYFSPLQENGGFRALHSLRPLLEQAYFQGKLDASQIDADRAEWCRRYEKHKKEMLQERKAMVAAKKAALRGNQDLVSILMELRTQYWELKEPEPEYYRPVTYSDGAEGVDPETAFLEELERVIRHISKIEVKVLSEFASDLPTPDEIDDQGDR